MVLRKNEVHFTKLRKTYEISIPFSEKSSRRRRIINLDLFLRGKLLLQQRLFDTAKRNRIYLEI